MRAYNLEASPILAPVPGPWGKALEALRLQHHLTKKAMAKRAKMTATTYGRIEKGGGTRTQKLQAIADAFYLPIEAVLMIRPPDAVRQEPETPAMREMRSQIETLQREVATLRAQIRKKPTPGTHPTQPQLEAAERTAFDAASASVTLRDLADTAAETPKASKPRKNKKRGGK